MIKRHIIEDYGEAFFEELVKKHEPYWDGDARVWYWQDWQIEQVRGEKNENLEHEEKI